MKTNPLKEGALTENSAGIGTVTRQMVTKRAVQLAAINGRSAKDVSKSDWDQAKQELTGNADTNLKEEVLESAPESERWNPVAGSTGGKVPAAREVVFVSVSHIRNTCDDDCGVARHPQFSRTASMSPIYPCRLLNRRKIARNWGPPQFIFSPSH